MGGGALVLPPTWWLNQSVESLCPMDEHWYGLANAIPVKSETEWGKGDGDCADYKKMRHNTNLCAGGKKDDGKMDKTRRQGCGVDAGDGDASGLFCSR